MSLLPEGILEYIFNGNEPERSGNADPLMAPHGVFKCRDRPEKIAGHTIDQFVSIVCNDDLDWSRLARAMGQAELATEAKFATLAARKANEDELEAIINAWTGSRWAEDIAELLQTVGVAAAVVADNKYLAEDSHLRERGYWVYLDHPEVVKRQHAGVPWKMGRTATEVRAPAPLIGQHTDAILTELLGYTTEQVSALRARGALE